ncbi:unnamed protein product [Medioppia subpectinata]|uniref:C2H2-type domain-containing protein n=1 Tax=Medioppia subpectinata TaxID=1979941 RepID=A0A7R9L263_9ACAR|nr:unnamed protein product [Medioppia subpectinata]CAG2112955.1 unnamed protein product [Medioppia subpectinata]
MAEDMADVEAMDDWTPMADDYNSVLINSYSSGQTAAQMPVHALPAVGPSRATDRSHYKLLVEGFPSEVTETGLKNFLRRIGCQSLSVKIMASNRTSGSCRPLAIVDFSSAKSAQKAIELLKAQKAYKLAVHFISDASSLLDHLVKHSPDFGYFECKPCRKRITKFEPMKIHLKTHHAVGADEVCREVANLKDLFDDLLLKIKERNHQKNSYTAPKETENAIAGLMGEEFAVGYDNHFNGAVDPLADAMNQAFNEEFNGYEDNPEIHIAETEENGDEYGFIQEGEDGLWMPTAI